ncbi:hypothetical protein GLOIN_2v1779567 [Rhizophagus clarus]|uniref:Uncharacterized protein n=1 Tax=Rhizophagus clarus TaxID=94130 RepID=A0A8H3R4C5_9GLOM|nr:hypothetical protein GLOIN_2v1779567 [Rhizophagus clarus]
MSSIKCPSCPRIFSSRSGNMSLDSEEFMCDIEKMDADQNMITFDDQNEEANKSFNQSMTICDDKSGQNKTIFEDILENSDLNQEFETEVNTSYPNEAYADLMILVTKHKLNNIMGNAIIKFFNKHANFNISPLPKSIEKGCKYMDNMNIPNLTYSKICVIKYNNKDYLLSSSSVFNKLCKTYFINF